MATLGVRTCTSPAVAPHFRRVRAPCGAAQRVVATNALTAPQQTIVSDAYQRLKGVQVIRCSDGAKLDITGLWGPAERAVVVWARTFGCPFCWELAIQLRRDIKPILDEQGVKLFLVAIGTLERSKDFVEVTGFPAERLLADPDSKTYEALGLVKGVRQTFFDQATPLSLLKRMTTPGGMDDLKDKVLPRWQPWQPPQLDQALQQGGIFVFDGESVAYSHYDQATGAHADLNGVLSLVQGIVARSEAGAAACAASSAPGATLATDS